MKTLFTVSLALVMLATPLTLPAHGIHGLAEEPSQARWLAPSVVDTPPDWVRALTGVDSRVSEGSLLRESLADAPVLLHGTTLGGEPLDEGRLMRVSLSVEGVYRGDVARDRVRVVEFSGARESALPMAPGQSVFLALAPMPGHSYLRELLGEGGYYALTREQPVPIPVDSAQGASALGQWLLLGRSEPSARSRALALTMMASGERALTPLALSELKKVPLPDALSRQETESIQRIMTQSLPGKGALALLLAQWQLSAMLPELKVQPGDDPVTVARIRLARHLLGQDPDPVQLLEQSHSADPVERAAAGRLLGLLNDDRARDRAAELALEDEELPVRTVALHALAESGDLRVLPVLTRALDTPHQSLRFQAGRALGHFPLTARSAALEQVLLQGSHRESREYAAKLLVYHRGLQDQQVRALRRAVAPGELQRILTEGAVDHSRLHSHDGHDH